MDYCAKNSITIDYIVYVPISYKRYIERGYNQSYLIAKALSKHTAIPLKKFCLIKIKNNERQSELLHEQRENNTKGVYCVNKLHEIKGKCLLLVDDIYTTGATANECSKVLKMAGANSIIVTTIAKA